MTIDNKDGAAFLAYVTDKLETRIAHISQSILEGQKDIEEVPAGYRNFRSHTGPSPYSSPSNTHAFLRYPSVLPERKAGTKS